MLRVLRLNVAQIGERFCTLVLMTCLCLVVFVHAEVCAESIGAEAINSEDAFTARLPVAARTAEVDPALVLEGLKQVIARFRSSGQSFNEQGERALLKQPMDSLRDYRYESPVDPALGAALLVLHYEGDAIMLRLQQTQALVVEAQGIKLLHWWALESGAHRQLIGDPKAVWSTATTKPFAEALAAASTAHSLSMFLPLMDPRDERLVQPRDVFGFLLEPIQKASQRYPHDGLVIGSVKPTVDVQWEGHWMLVISGRSYWFEGKKPSLEKLLEQAMTVIDQQLLTMKQVDTPIGQPQGQSQWLAISVTQLTSFSAQQALETYLSSLSWIEDAQLQKITTQQATYRLRTAVPATNLSQRFAEDGRLQLLDASLSAASSAVSTQASGLSYRWTN